MAGEVIIGIVSTVASVAGTAVGAIQQSNQARAIAADQERQATEQITQANQEEAQRRENLRSELATIDAIRSGRGLSLGSPTGLQIRDTVATRGLRDIRVGRTNARAQADQFRRSAQISRSAARSSLVGGLLSAGVQGASLIPLKKSNKGAT